MTDRPILRRKCLLTLAELQSKIPAIRPDTMQRFTKSLVDPLERLDHVLWEHYQGTDLMA